MIDSPSTTTDALCQDCAHMRPDGEGGRWCHSPQILKAQNGRGTRCVFEVDNFLEKERSREKGTEKCGPQWRNFKRRETV